MLKAEIPENTVSWNLQRKEMKLHFQVVSLQTLRSTIIKLNNFQAKQRTLRSFQSIVLFIQKASS